MRLAFIIAALAASNAHAAVEVVSIAKPKPVAPVPSAPAPAPQPAATKSACGPNGCGVRYVPRGLLGRLLGR